jgi:hypothetical protein
MKEEIPKIELIYNDFQKLKAEFYAHNHADIVPPPKGDKSNILNARLLKIGSSQVNSPAIQMAEISTDPASPSNGDIWFEGGYLKIRIGNKTAHFIATTTSTSTTTTSSSTTIT